MKVVRTAAELPRHDETGLVPTMGAFHEGHLALFLAAREENELVVASLFVNSAQFAEGEDLARYPRDEARDAELAEQAGVAVLFVLIRAVTRSPVLPAVVGLIGIALSAGLALFTGRAEENFVLGFVINAVWLVALLVSLLVRRPLIGLISSLLTGDRDWRADAAKRSVLTVATWLWVGMFALRLGVQVPLYLAEQAAALAATKLLMGVPLYAAVLWITWLMVRSVYARREA